ncbi:hypothetical protein HBH26_06435 [Sphingomonas sp. 36D10-4-7]|jgi:hypothetical protein|uniref:Uncharacterized protein n=2 Tax=Sphingomonas corticis TaxID=2722791 RepID=A0ABX1CJT5_9SPHN|nr:hypothetical protein [Sphingomonas corticis]NJR78254.1 hypothetical protein [Sphingomonas corticis]
MGEKKKKRIPKTVAGVKVPKELRKAGEKLLDQAQRPETQAKIAGVLTMAAGAVAAAAAKKRAEQAAPRPQEPRAEAHAGRTGTDPQAVADAIGQAAEQVLSKLFGRRV